MTAGPTAEALLHRKRAARGRAWGEREGDPGRCDPADTKVFARVFQVCLVGIVGAAALAEVVGLGR